MSTQKELAMPHDKTPAEVNAGAKALRIGVGALVLLGLSIAWLFYGPELLNLQRELPDSNVETISQAVSAMQQRIVVVAKWIVPTLALDGLALLALVLSYKHFRVWGVQRQQRLAGE